MTSDERSAFLRQLPWDADLPIWFVELNRVIEVHESLGSDVPFDNVVMRRTAVLAKGLKERVSGREFGARVWNSIDDFWTRIIRDEWAASELDRSHPEDARVSRGLLNDERLRALVWVTSPPRTERPPAGYIGPLSPPSLDRVKLQRLELARALAESLPSEREPRWFARVHGRFRRGSSDA